MLAAALVLSLTPGTAGAQSADPPTVVEVRRDGITLTVEFSETVVRPVCSAVFTYSVDGGEPQASPVLYANFVLGTLRFGIPSSTPANAAIKVFYDLPQTPTCRLQSHTGGQRFVEPFGWDLSTGQRVATPMQIEQALEGFFSGRTPLSEVEQLARLGMQHSGYAAALEELVSGEGPGGVGPLSALFKVGRGRNAGEPRTVWGTPGTQNWVQMGVGAFPREMCYTPPGGQLRCVDTQAEWGWGTQHQCGGRSQPGLHRRDVTSFFWACTPGGQWVPVKLPRPDIDYTPVSELRGWQWTGLAGVKNGTANCYLKAPDSRRGEDVWRRFEGNDCDLARAGLQPRNTPTS